MAKKKDKTWESRFDVKDGIVYVGHEVRTNQIFIGGRYYSDTAQIHLTIDEAKWLRKYLLEAYKRRNKP